jgi:hypothetical protein
MDSMPPLAQLVGQRVQQVHMSGVSDIYEYIHRLPFRNCLILIDELYYSHGREDVASF